MKTKSLFIAFISLVLALSVISCNNDTAYEGVKNNAEYVKLHIGQMGLNSRQIDKVNFYEEYKDASYVLSGSLKTEDDKFEKEYKGLSELETASIEIKTGTWTFTLLAYNSDDEIKTNGILSDTKEFEITSDSKTLDFSLEFCEEQTLTGNLEYTVTVPYVDSASMTVTLVKDGTVFSPKEPYDVLSGYSKSLFAVDPVSYKKYGQMSTGNEVIEMLPLVQKDDSYQTTFIFENLSVGTYQLRIVYTTDYMEDDLYRETTENETNIVVYPLVTRTGSTIIKNINKAYKITYAKSEAYSPDTSNLPNVIDKLGKITLPALERTQYTFDGWYYWLNDEKKTLTSDVDKDGNTIYNLYGSTLSSNIELYTAWTEIPLGNFAVTFNSMGGSPVDNQIIEENSCATKPADPERAGYTFGGWYTNSDYDSDTYDFVTPVTAPITLYAKWTINTYTITYSGIDEDATNPNADINTYTVESNTISLADASKTGYTFDGWFDAEGNKVTSIDKGSTGNKTFTAQWTIEEYEVTFMTNCYNGTSDKPINYSFVVSYNEKASEYVQRISPLTREGYTLEGWYTDSTFKNKYDFDTPVTAALTLYANWTINTYTITYSSDYGEAFAVKTVEWGTKLSEDDIAEIEAEGWVFKGWKISETSTYATTDTTVTDNITLTADWSIAQITISYETTHGTAPETQTVDYGTVLDEYLTEIDADGYDFDGWLVAGKAAVAETTLTADITLTASWTVKTYSITYNGVEDEENPNDAAEYTIESDAITLADASKDGYTFKGWFTTETFDEGTEETGIAKGSTGDKVFYAKWEINLYTVSFETNWSEWTIDAEQIEYKSTITEPTKQREGYTLEGWFTDSDFQNMYDFDTPITAPITLYANWTINTYTITYSTTYGVAPEAKTVEWGSKLTEDDLAEIEAEGWVFNGWKIGDTGTYATTETTVTDNIILTADWSIVQITISYETAHGTAPETQTVDYGTILATAHLEEIEADGYDFDGWFLEGKEAEAGTTLKANITLTASWTAKIYSITYNGVEDAENPNDAAEYTIESDAITLADASKDGYTFKGWFTTETFDEGTEETEITAGSTGDKTFYAKWTPITYNIVYNLDGGENPAAAVETYTIEDEVTLPTPEKSGYTFLGWYDAETDGNKVETISIGSTEDKEYWAKWSQTFTISVEFEAIPQVTASGSWELVKETRTVHNDITDEDEQYDVFVAPEDCDSYTWYVDGVQVEVDSETPNEYRPSGSGGTHSVNCLIIRTVTGDDGKEKEETIYLTGSFTLTVRYLPMG